MHRNILFGVRSELQRVLINGFKHAAFCPYREILHHGGDISSLRYVTAITLKQCLSGDHIITNRLRLCGPIGFEVG